jgi:hypothetical protein
MYFTDSETTLLVINKWTGGGVKLNLVKTVDTDILRTIVIKLQKRIQSKSKTLLIKVKVNRGYPLNEETDIRAEMGRMKEEQEKTWSVYDRKQVKSNPTKHTRRGRKSGGRSTYQGKEKETSPKKGRNHWKTKTYGGTKQTYSRWSTNPERGEESITLRRLVHTLPKGDNHVNFHNRLASPGGGGKRVVGKMDEDDLG